MYKILIVDDSTTVRDQLKADLSRSGFEVIEAVDGVDGYNKAQTITPHLIISDVNMPNLDGLGMCERLHGDIATSNIPIFMLTTEVVGDMKERAKKIGVKAWISKPYSAEKLVQAITKFLSKPA
jgi:two-component system chemotaxis response regulator CheY